MSTQELINKKNKEIELLNKELERKNRTDGLTSLYNRTALFEFLEQERKRTVRELWRMENSRTSPSPSPRSPPVPSFGNAPLGDIDDHFGVFSVMMIDLDHFKQINDTHGHLSGDDVLRSFGDIFRERHVLRDNDIVGRFGGEEFIVILPETCSAHAGGPARRLAKTFGGIEFRSAAGETFHVTLSIGVSEYHPADAGCDDVIARADQALYFAKEHGRNQVVVFEESVHNSTA